MAHEEEEELSQTTSPREAPQRRQVVREQRDSVQLAISVCGVAATGELFVEHCSTLNVSHSGCCIRLQTRPLADAALALRLMRWGISANAASQLLFQVAWVREDGDGWLVGASSLGRADLYCVAFPGNL